MSPSAVASAAPRETGVEDGGYVKGVALAVVTQNKDRDGMGRVKLRFPWFDQPRESVWARVAMPMAGNGRGFALIPEVDDEVVVCFERGDLRFPIVVGCVHGGKDKIPFANEDGKNDKRVFRSRAGHELVFDDGKKGSVELSLKDGKKVLIDDDSVTVQDEKGNHFKIDSRSGAVEISASGKLTLKAADVEITATATLKMQAGPTLALNAGTIMINC
ncbi:phage baseplate assembly protein V [Paraburkholderia graminis]|uniref:phage baseplate assembly protein V n=1 Tax=Paraburkholderia graminis TaxID=60548 RepID=UPI0038BB04C7